LTILRIYTDGGCAGNQNDTNIGGWGAILEFGEHQKELYGGELNTTNNRMEMTALLEAFKAIKKENQTIEVFSDSGYLMDCFRDKWYERWLANGWKTSGKKPVENQDLWQELIPFLSRHNITFYRVKGHLNLNHPSTNVEKHFSKFKEWNGTHQSFEMFEHSNAMNHRADQLANIGIDQLR
jgi:ribonuclease HI